MKRVVGYVVIMILLVVAVLAWLILGSATDFSEKNKYVFIATGHTNRSSIIDSLEQNRLLQHPAIFRWVATRMKVWDKVKAGRFEIKKGQSILSIARMLRNNRQSPVNFTILKLRVKEDLARVIDKYFEADSSSVSGFLNNADSLKTLNVDTNTLMTLVIPDSYTMYWTTPVRKILERLRSEQQAFWKKNNRVKKAREMGFSPVEIYTIASIVEEETNKDDEKGNIASVYINRYRKGMLLGADPTVKFALKNFALKRIYEKYTQVESPYNTYRTHGLPPGPICTPSSRTIDAVLNAPATDYIFFVAKSDFSGHHTFTSNYAEHLKYAHEYQKALDEYLSRKNNP